MNLVMGETTEVTNFQKLFMQKRIEQLAAVKNILKLDDTKRKLLLDQITTKLFQVGVFKLYFFNFHVYCTIGFVHWSSRSGKFWLRCWLESDFSRPSHGEGLIGVGEHVLGERPVITVAGGDGQKGRVQRQLGNRL